MRKCFIFLFVFFFAVNGHTAQFFTEDWETASTTWKCSDSDGVATTNWDEGYSSCGTPDEWKICTGRNGGNAMCAYKNNTVPNGYRSEFNHWFTGANVKREIYHRWYMKFPSTFDKDIPDSCKLWRYINAPNGSPPNEIYLNFHGGAKISSSSISVLTNNATREMYAVNNFNDNQWHSHELRIKMNTQGQSDGVIQYWLDGTQQFSATNLNLGFTSAEGINRVGVGMGNCSDPEWDMSAWTAIAFDDIIIAEEYIGPDGGPAISTATGCTISGASMQ
jgi:hypothetical protein